MPQKMIHLSVQRWRSAFCLGIFLFVHSCVFGEGNTNRPATAQQVPGRIKMTGCLKGGADQFSLATADSERWFVLTGETSGLGQFVDKKITLEGTRGDSVWVDGFFDPFPSFEVAGIVEVFEMPRPELNLSFSDKSTWIREKDRRYGVAFAHPAKMAHSEPSESAPTSSSDTETLEHTIASFDIPGDTYSAGNFRGGSFAIFVHPQLLSNANCGQVGTSNGQETASPHRVGKLQYMETRMGGAAMGTWYSEYHFQIFQHGSCYEVAFEFVEYSAHTADTGCNIPLLSRQDESKLIDALLAKVSFFRPTPPSAQKMN